LRICDLTHPKLVLILSRDMYFYITLPKNNRTYPGFVFTTVSKTF
jgi:hypothetical protein